MRTRMLAGLALLLTTGLVAASAASGVLLDRFLDDRNENVLRVNAAQYRDALARGPQTVYADQMQALVGAPLGVVGVGADDSILFSTDRPEVDTGRLLAVTGTLAAYEVGEEPGNAPEFLCVRVPSPGLRIAWPDGREVSPAALILYLNTSDDEGTLNTLLVRQAVVVVCVLVLTLALAVTVLRVGMRPLVRMARTANAIAAGSLASRLPTRGDRSETDQLAHAVNRAFDTQARAEETVRSFAADASHELRTPLATISGWLDLYHQGAIEGPAVATAFAQIDAEAGRMRLLVEDLGLLVRLDAGRPLAQDEVDLTALADGIVADAQVIYPDRAITLSAPGPIPLTGDAPRLEQVLRNLVGNAVQHTPDDTAVRVEVATDGEQVTLKVIDDGPGIAAADLPRVFERFWRAEGSRSRAYGGSGLGLAIVEAITHAHHGTIAVDSTVGAGTTVTLVLPARPPEPVSPR
ncbi:hypothetical protein Asp14428_13540 [Actinoplanes sp. NBRC 14428]|uniref:histidine kinase n=1 Tax=Pseudosporangium ferrugineum TaxID=439699 RepID=A0A2T0SEN5_9ACTN|nr:HAMP domain-containing sensor histidine kinase [Pseudosporangium ferrugineum]PRY31885.1 two-component system OmpR family sensor kinase [Pseudosporangium ferrugineum]BCJ49879.1 hypothetical protein Asp14428_13540 [Actinoplanes sp. NBRC 14428]